MPRPRKGSIEYSDIFEDTVGNYNWATQFDIYDGFLGITQFQDNHVPEHFLLSPNQIKKLKTFLKHWKI